MAANDDGGPAQDSNPRPRRGEATEPPATARAASSSSSSSATAPSTGQQQLPLRTAMAVQREGLTQALEELAKGERAADKIEAELEAFEAKLEALLVSMGIAEEDLDNEDADGKPKDKEATDDKPKPPAAE